MSTSRQREQQRRLPQIADRCHPATRRADESARRKRPGWFPATASTPARRHERHHVEASRRPDGDKRHDRSTRPTTPSLPAVPWRSIRRTRSRLRAQDREPRATIRDQRRMKRVEHEHRREQDGVDAEFRRRQGTGDQQVAQEIAGADHPLIDPGPQPSSSRRRE